MLIVDDLIQRVEHSFQTKGALPVELAEAWPEDLAEIVQRIEPEEGAWLLSQLDPEQAAQTLVEAPTATVKDLVPLIADQALAAYLDILPMDDAIDLQEEVEPERWERLLGLIPPQDAAEIRRLAGYPLGSVGRLMTEAYFHVSPDATMESILQDLRSASAAKYEMVNDLYVLDESKVLLGVMSLRRVIRSHPLMTAAEVMNDDVVSVRATDEDESAARTMSRYGLYALPVLDSAGRMAGIFTGDDAQQVLQEADTEDVLALGAVSGPVEAYMSLTVVELYKRRMPWLLALFVAETFTGNVIRFYGQSDDALQISPLMYFLPLLIGAGGNAGSQVTTTITRALAVGDITGRDWFTVVGREFWTACMIGLTLGLIGGVRAMLPPPIGWQSTADYSILIGLALPAIVVWASTIGSSLPIIAKRMGLDPAVLSAPFITTFVDATGLIIYFEIAKRVVAELR